MRKKGGSSDDTEILSPFRHSNGKTTEEHPIKNVFTVDNPGATSSVVRTR